MTIFQASSVPCGFKAWVCSCHRTFGDGYAPGTVTFRAVFPTRPWLDWGHVIWSWGSVRRGHQEQTDAGAWGCVLGSGYGGGGGLGVRAPPEGATRARTPLPSLARARAAVPFLPQAPVPRAFTSRGSRPPASQTTSCGCGPMPPSPLKSWACTGPSVGFWPHGQDPRGRVLCWGASVLRVPGPLW